MTDWHIITGEYPPQPGGVSDYTHLIAEELVRAGDAVNVWASPLRIGDCGSRIENGVRIERLPNHFGLTSLRALTRALDRRPAPRRLLVQYVPHAFGWKAANVLFCAWLRSRRRDSVWVMFHEVSYPFGRDESLAHNALAGINRVMASLVAGVAERAFVSIPAWQPLVQRLAVNTSVDWLPVPSSVPVAADPCETARVRARYADGSPLVGHFGTYGGSIGSMLEPAVRSIVDRTRAQVLLLGRRSDLVARAFEERHPDLKGRIVGAGPLSLEDLSHHISACEVMVQPYPDGISTRRTSAMAALAHGRPIVTTSGWLTEALWEDTGAVALVAAAPPDAIARATAALLDDESARCALSSRARTTYVERFDVVHTIRALRRSPR